LAAELLVVQLCMSFRELVNEFFVCRMRLLERTARPRLGARVRGNLVREQLSPRFSAFPARSCLNEINHGTENVLRRFEKTAVDSDFVRGEADDDYPVLCEADAVMRVKP
jgi:hypothetical protein